MPARALLLVVLTGLMFLPGCGGPSLAPARGRVTCDGKPVKEAALTFAPVPKSENDKEPGKPATGFSDADGYFVLSTYKPLDGALIGQHKVTITLDDTNPARCKRLKHINLEVKAEGNDFTIEMKE